MALRPWLRLHHLGTGDAVEASVYGWPNAAADMGEAMKIKTWRQRCEEHPDHNGIVSDGMIQARMQEEIDELRTKRQWKGLTADEIWDAWCEQAKPERDTKNFVAAFARVVEAKLKEKNHG